MPIAARDTARAHAPPRGTAVAGVIFSVLMGISLIIVRLVVPAYQVDSGVWLNDSFRRTAVRFAIQLVPFAGIAFLWLIGVLRNRLGALEDKDFATVLLGSGMLLVGSLFASAALVQAVGSGRLQALNNDYMARQLGGSFLDVFAIKMAGAFVVSTSTIVFRTSILPAEFRPVARPSAAR